MQTMEEMIKTYYKENKSKALKLATKIEKKIQKLASKGETCYEECFLCVRAATLNKVVQIFTDLGYPASINEFELFIFWKKPEEL